VLTLFPPVWGVEDKPDSNGANGLLWAWYWKGHPFAAAIAAQEVREVRRKAPFAIAGLVIGAVAGSLIAIEAALIGGMAVLLIAGLILRRKSFRRKLEILGQSAECVVRRDYYAAPIEKAIDDAANQLAGYDQFEGWSVDRIRSELVAAIPSADKWVRSHQALVERAL
jgi:hypothetical protein